MFDFAEQVYLQSVADARQGMFGELANVLGQEVQPEAYHPRVQHDADHEMDGEALEEEVEEIDDVEVVEVPDTTAAVPKTRPLGSVPKAAAKPLYPKARAAGGAPPKAAAVLALLGSVAGTKGVGAGAVELFCYVDSTEYHVLDIFTIIGIISVLYLLTCFFRWCTRKSPRKGKGQGHVKSSKDVELKNPAMGVDVNQNQAILTECPTMVFFKERDRAHTAHLFQSCGSLKNSAQVATNRICLTCIKDYHDGRKYTRIITKFRRSLPRR